MAKTLEQIQQEVIDELTSNISKQDGIDEFAILMIEVSAKTTKLFLEKYEESKR